MNTDIKWGSYIVFGVACALVIGIYCWSAESGFHEVINPQAEDSYYNLLVQGFESGHLSVKRAAPTELAGLDNPYDPAVNAPYVWDAHHLCYELCYYRGKLFLYQGITPALVLFWPYAMLTGEYCSHKTAVVFFLTLGFLVAAGLIFATWRRYFPETNVWLAATTVLAPGLATGCLENLASSDEHQVPHLCGFAFTMLALAALWNSLHRPRWQVVWLACASLSYGLAVGARPSLLFGIVILFLPVVQTWRTAKEPSLLVGRAGWLLFAAVTPAALVGLGLATYNYLRFESPFEFGWRYLLTDIQNTHAEPFSLNYFWFNWKLYFLETVHWHSYFPFLQASQPATPPPSNYYGVGEAYCGVLLNYPVVWLALAAPLAWRGRTSPDVSALRVFLAVILLLFIVNAFVLCCFFSGSSGYLSDFLPALMLLAAVGVLGLENNLKTASAWRHIARAGWVGLLIFSVLFNVFASLKTRALDNYIQGNSLIHMRQTEEAVAYYKKSLALEPDLIPALLGLGVAETMAGDLTGGIMQYQKTLVCDPENAEALYGMGMNLIQSGQADQAIVHLTKLLKINPVFFENINPAINNNFAWSLATHHEASYRSGKIAVILAEAACRKTHYQTTMMVGTLAAAYAEAGRFDEAISTAQKAISLATVAGNQDLMNKNQRLLSLYQAHQAYHEN